MELYYNCTINTNVAVMEAFKAISNDISEWWTNKFEGSAKNIDDVFIVRFGGAEVTMRVVGFIPGRKIFWRVIDSNFPSLTHKIAWTDTKIVWEILPGDNAAQVRMTHIGLTPEKECYADSVTAWNLFIKEKLAKLLNKTKVKTVKRAIEIPAELEEEFLVA